MNNQTLLIILLLIVVIVLINRQRSGRRRGGDYFSTRNAMFRYDLNRKLDDIEDKLDNQ